MSASQKTEPEKSYLNGAIPEKTTSMEAGKATSMEAEKATSDYLPREFVGVMENDQLKALLTKKGQREWTTKNESEGFR